MTVTAKNEDGTVECFYDSSIDKDIVFLNVPDKHGTNMVVPVDKLIIEDTIEALQNINELMHSVGAIRNVGGES